MLPNITIELRHIEDDTYESRILSPQNEEILRSKFKFKEDDSYYVHGTKYLEEDAGRKDKDVEPEFIQRMGKHFYDLITGGKNEFKNHLRFNPELKGAYCLTVALDISTIKEKTKITLSDYEKDPLQRKLIEALQERQKENPEGVERLSKGADLLWQIPWEYLHDGNDFLALTGKAYLTRKPIGLGELPAIQSPQPLRLLVVVSSPNGLPELNSEKEIGIIQEVLDPPRRGGYLEIDYLEIPTLSNLRSKIKHFQPHILHYTGHGGKVPISNETFLACEDDDGEQKPIFGDDLSRIASDNKSLQLVVLSGCMTAQTHNQDALRGVGTSLLRGNLPAVLAMQYSILDDSGIEFARKFYEELGKGSSVLEAVNEVRLRLYELRGKDRADWGLPALYLRTPEIHLIDTTIPPKPKATKTEQVNIGGLPIVRGFVGRKTEIRSIRQAISNKEITAVYIYGLGGVGKTALASKIIEKAQLDKSIEAYLVIRCDKIEPTFANVIEKLANFISFQGKEGHAQAGQILKDSRISIDERVSLLNNAIKESRYLFIFDNFESLYVKQAPVGVLKDEELTKFFSSVIDHNWHSTFLFTCRYQWRLLSETKDKGNYSKCGLPLENLLTIHLPGLTAHQTIQHMNNLAGPLSRLEYKKQLELLPVVKGHPKTIEFLDSYLKKYPVSQVLEVKDLREKAVEDVGKYFMDGLWQDLNKDEQEALANLAVFRTPLKEQNIQKLVPKKDAINKLMGYSLVQLEGEGRGYVVHPVVSEYVLNKIGKDERKRLHNKAVKFYIHKYDDLLKRVSTDDKIEPLNILCAIMEMMTQRGMREQAEMMTTSMLEIHYHLFKAEDYEHANDIVEAMIPFLHMQGLIELAQELLNKSINTLKSSKKYAAMGNLATLLQDEGKWGEALRIHQQCFEFFKQKGIKSQMTISISQQAQIYQERGEHEKALELEQEALALDKEMDNKEGIVTDYYRIAQLLYRMERHVEALDKANEGRKLAQESGNQWLEAAFYHLVGLLFNRLDRPKEAYDHFKQSLAINERTGNKAAWADSLGEIGKLMNRAGQFKEALEYNERALNIYRELGNPVKVGISLEAIGLVFEKQGHYEEALIKYQEAIQLQRQYGNPKIQAIVEQHITRVKKRMGQLKT